MLVKLIPSVMVNINTFRPLNVVIASHMVKYWPGWCAGPSLAQTGQRFLQLGGTFS